MTGTRRGQGPGPGCNEEDDAEVYGDAWLLVEEWRGLWIGHPHDGNILSWLSTQAGLLDLAMLEGHRLTLPLETRPLRDFGRRGQTGWRGTALRDTKMALTGRSGPWWTKTPAESQGPDSRG